MSPTYLVTSQQTLTAASQTDLENNSLTRSGMAVLTFSMVVVDHLTRLCGLEEMTWILPHYHPYCTAGVVKHGKYRGMDVIVLVPPMGASPLACVLEDLIACGIQVAFLVCAAWSLGSPVELGDLIVPAFSMGLDGTSIHYGNTNGYIPAEPLVVEALITACRKHAVTTHVGGNASCEALYRITPQMAANFSLQSCVCMDNGEASTLFSVTQELGILGGVLFQPYINLVKGWNPTLLNERYHIASIIQAEIVLEAGFTLQRVVNRICK
jgi:uridine phosphorylase